MLSEKEKLAMSLPEKKRYFRDRAGFCDFGGIQITARPSQLSFYWAQAYRAFGRLLITIRANADRRTSLSALVRSYLKAAYYSGLSSASPVPVTVPLV